MPIIKDNYSRRVEGVRRLHQPLRSPKTPLLLKMKKVHFVETSGINNPATQRSKPEDTNIQYKTSNLKPVFYTVFIR
jgi:hypothetical protein